MIFENYNVTVLLSLTVSSLCKDVYLLHIEFSFFRVYKNTIFDLVNAVLGTKFIIFLLVTLKATSAFRFFH
jgi:hypothetical protein